MNLQFISLIATLVDCAAIFSLPFKDPNALASINYEQMVSLCGIWFIEFNRFFGPGFAPCLFIIKSLKSELLLNSIL